MNTKHTPGPWFVMNGTDIFTGLAAKNAAGIETTLQDGWHIADCSMGPSWTSEATVKLSFNERMANARLIAAAPEMLAALQIVADSMPVECAGFSEVCAAIAHATGEQP